MKILSASLFAIAFLLVVFLQVHYECTKGPDPYLVHRLDTGRFKFESGWTYRIEKATNGAYNCVVKSAQMAYGDTTWAKIMICDQSPNVGISLTPENGLLVVRFDSLPPYNPVMVYPSARYYGDSTWYLFNYPGVFKNGVATFGYDNMPVQESRPETGDFYDYTWEVVIKTLDSRVLPERDGWKIIPARPPIVNRSCTDSGAFFFSVKCHCEEPECTLAVFASVFSFGRRSKSA